MTIFEATLAEYGINLYDLAGGTTDSGPDVKAMCVNFLLGVHDIPWDWCDCHLADKAAENAFGTSADPQKSKNKDAREIMRLVIKTAAKVNQSATFKQKFEEIQLAMLDEIFKITKHAPQRWLSLVRVMERIIRLWHVLRKVYADDGEEFPLDKGNNKDAILQLYSLLQPLTVLTRDGQYGAVPMTAEMHMAFAVLKTEVLDPAQPLRVFDIPPAPASPESEQGREGGQERKGDRPKLPSTLVAPAKLRPVTVKTRAELSKALVQRLYGRVWDTQTADPSPYRDAAVLLTPPFNTGKYLEALRLTKADAEYLAGGKKHLAPTTDDEVKSKLDSCWADISKRAVKAGREEQRRCASAVVDGQLPTKRLRVGGPGSNASTASKFSSFGRSAGVGSAEEVKEGAGDEEEDVVGRLVSGDILRYQSLFMQTSEVCLPRNSVISVTGKLSEHVKREGS